MVRSPALSGNVPTETKSAASPGYVAPAAPDPTSSGGLQYRMLRYRDEFGEIPDDAMARAIRERLALIERELKRAGVTRDNWTSLGPASTYGGRVNALYVDRTNPQHLLAGAATGGIWQTNDAGPAFSVKPPSMGTLQPYSTFSLTLPIRTKPCWVSRTAPSRTAEMAA